MENDFYLIIYGLYISSLLWIVSPPTQPVPSFVRDAMCVAWGQDHYRTFDGTVYAFQGQCEYVLAKDCTGDSFHVNVINDHSCTQAAPCHR